MGVEIAPMLAVSHGDAAIRILPIRIQRDGNVATGGRCRYHGRPLDSKGRSSFSPLRPLNMALAVHPRLALRPFGWNYLWTIR
jgi:hypothetical protein